MANTTVYPFGTNGELPGGIRLVDYTVGGWDNALAAESGRELYQMMLEETDIYAQNHPQQEYKAASAGAPGYYVDGTTGSITQSAYTEPFVNEFQIDLVNKDYLASYGFGATQTTFFALNYYDAEWNFLGGAYKNPGSDPATSVEFAGLIIPTAWESDVETFKATAKYIRICGSTSSSFPRKADLYEVWTVPQTVLPQDATPNELYIFASVIRTPLLVDGTNNSTEITTTGTPSPWGVIFPSTYNKVGTPTPVVAMLHGSDGYVADGHFGYDSSEWNAMKNAYLSAGFAVMDINGYGASTQADLKSKHWGCPLAVETLDKAFEFLKKNYNVCDKILLHGKSMGAALAISYTKCFSGKVAGVGLLAPTFLLFSARFNDFAGMYEAWGYADKTDAESDNFNNFTGYSLFSECFVYGQNGGVFRFDWADYDDSTKAAILTSELIEHLPATVRVWQGTADTTVPKEYSQLLVSSLRRGNTPATLRLCSGATHNIESNSYVRNEVVDFFKRFVNKMSE